ncbi:MAG: hypothetical protein GY703_11550, partial [Gammaproteobacteria bacterium]|nr:hypothetical protein [Gammaproteobacteria bacterium]
MKKYISSFLDAQDKGRWTAFAVVLQLLSVGASAAVAPEGRISIVPETITPAANGIIAFALEVEGVPVPGLQSYFLNVEFSGENFNPVDSLTVFPGSGQQFPPDDKVTCAGVLSENGPTGSITYPNLAFMGSGHGQLIKDSKGDGRIIATENGWKGNTAVYNIGVGGAGTDSRSGDGTLIEFRCYAGPNVPESTVIEVTPTVWNRVDGSPYEGAILLGGSGSRPIINTFSSGLIAIGEIDVNDAPTGTTLVVEADEETATPIDISANVSDVDGTVDLTTTTVTGGP